jgi:hypothetical protein
VDVLAEARSLHQAARLDLDGAHEAVEELVGLHQPPHLGECRRRMELSVCADSGRDTPVGGTSS